MDKYDLVLDLTEHPENYSDAQIAEIMADPEAKAIYDVLCRTASSAVADLTVTDDEVARQWEAFAREHPVAAPPVRRWLFGSRAASIAVLILSSLVAVAVGVTVTVGFVRDKAPDAPPAEVAAPVAADSIIVAADASDISTQEVVLFENRPVSDVLAVVGRLYGVTVRYDDPHTATLRLYFRLDTSLPLDDVIAQLCTFEQINISRNGQILTVH